MFRKVHQSQEARALTKTKVASCSLISSRLSLMQGLRPRHHRCVSLFLNALLAIGRKSVHTLVFLRIFLLKFLLGNKGFD